MPTEVPVQVPEVPVAVPTEVPVAGIPAVAENLNAAIAPAADAAAQ